MVTGLRKITPFVTSTSQH